MNKAITDLKYLLKRDEYRKILKIIKSKKKVIKNLKKLELKSCDLEYFSTEKNNFLQKKINKAKNSLIKELEKNGGEFKKRNKLKKTVVQ